MSWKTLIQRNIREITVRYAFLHSGHAFHLSSPAAIAIYYTKINPYRNHQSTNRCCNTGEASAGARAFVLSDFEEIKTLNPSFPFLVREAQDIDAQFEVTFHGAFPERKTEDLNGMTKEQIAGVLQSLVAYGQATPKSESIVPRPIAEALAEDDNGRHASVAWPLA